MEDRLLEVEGVSKQYRLGAIGGGTLQGDLVSWFARIRGKEDPNAKIGMEHIRYGEKFWALRDINFTVDRGDAAGELPALNFEGYTFLGWFDAETDAPYDPNAPLTESRRFVAKWERSSAVSTRDQLRQRLEIFADQHNWTVPKLFNYLLAAGLTGVFLLTLAGFFLGGVIRRRKGGKRHGKGR